MTLENLKSNLDKRVDRCIEIASQELKAVMRLIDSGFKNEVIEHVVSLFAMYLEDAVIYQDEGDTVAAASSCASLGFLSSLLIDEYSRMDDEEDEN